jgi:N-hydroxyarylamine O-acetyltransferase
MQSSLHPGLDLEAYFRRIGFTGDPVPTLAVLCDIQLRHALTIPWEDLNILLRWPIKLDLASLTQKLLYDHRGGYCFEQNTLLQAVLETIGFEVTPLQARVLWMVGSGQ